MTMSDLALFILRIGVGLTFAAHGAQKAFGWWGGPGPERWAGAVRSMGFRPAGLFTVASIGAELVGGLMLAAGLLLPVATGILVAQFTVIIFQVHWQKGFFNTHGGIEYPLALLVATTAIALLGGGSLSLDRALGLSLGPELGPPFILAGLIAGAVALAVPRVLAARAVTGRPPAGAA